MTSIIPEHLATISANIAYNHDDWLKDPSCGINTSYLISSLNQTFLDAKLNKPDNQTMDYASRVLVSVITFAANNPTALVGANLMHMGETVFLGNGWKAFSPENAHLLAAMALAVNSLLHNRLSVYAGVFEVVHTWTGSDFPEERDVPGLATMLFGPLWSQLYAHEMGPSLVEIFQTIRVSSPVVVSTAAKLVIQTVVPPDMPNDF